MYLIHDKRLNFVHISFLNYINRVSIYVLIGFSQVLGFFELCYPVLCVVPSEFNKIHQVPTINILNI